MIDLKKKLEIACFNLESAILAERAGADRIELCDNYKAGGITPSHESIKKAAREIKIPVHVIIRPRGGDFVYSTNELEQMKKDVAFCKTQHIQGIVFGCLTIQNEIDLHVCKELIDLAKPMSLTFHRAIDYCGDIDSQLEIISTLGVNRVLTSGTKDSAIEGITIINQLQTKFRNDIIVMPGGGIRSTNLERLLKQTHSTEVHSAAITDNSYICNEEEIKKMKFILAKS